MNGWDWIGTTIDAILWKLCEGLSSERLQRKLTQDSSPHAKQLLTDIYADLSSLQVYTERFVEELAAFFFGQGSGKEAVPSAFEPESPVDELARLGEQITQSASQLFIDLQAIDPRAKMDLSEVHERLSQFNPPLPVTGGASPSKDHLSRGELAAAVERVQEAMEEMAEVKKWLRKQISGHFPSQQAC